MTTDYKVSSFLHLYNDFWYNSLGYTCAWYYFLEGPNASQSASSSKSNIWFISSPIVLQWKDHISFIRSAIEVNEHLMDKLSNKYSPTSI